MPYMYFFLFNGYYRKFVKNNGTIFKSLPKLLKKREFHQADETLNTFEALKEAMSTTLVFAMPNFDVNYNYKPHFNVSAFRIRAILTPKSNVLWPIYYQKPTFHEKE